MNVVVIGASNKPNRYSYKVLKKLLENGHTVFPIHPRLEEIEGLKVFHSLKEISEKIDTITLYVASDRSTMMQDDIFSISPRRIIFNPGAENTILFKNAQEKGITAMNACTLVMLSTQQF